MSFDRWPITWKISLPIATILVFTVAICAISLNSLYSAMFDERLRKIQDISDGAAAIATHFHELETSGKLTREEAQTAAKAAIGAIRYEGNNYVFAYDYAGISLIHPKAAIVGTSMIDFADKTGVKIVAELIQAAKVGGGSLLYYWPRANSEVAVAKYGWGSGFKPWNWMIGTGVYMDDLDAAYWSAATMIIALAALGAAIAIAIAIVTVRSTVRPLTALTNNMNRLADGNTDIDIQGAGRGDEIGQMASAMEIFVENENNRRNLEQQQSADQEDAARKGAEIQQLSGDFDQQIMDMMNTIDNSVQNLQTASTDMTNVAEQTTEQSGRVSNASSQASHNVETVAAAAEELSASVNEIRRQVQSSSEIAAKAASEAENTNQRMNGLSESAGRIGEVVTLIQAIAEQTNLLALNATIEAARAGESGKGFAVVAAEVKELANQTSKATEEISSQISAIQEETGHAASGISSVTEIINNMNEIASSIASSVEEQGVATQEIASNATEASRSTVDVTTNIETVAAAAENTRDTADKVNSSARELEENAAMLRDQVGNFLGEVRARSAA
ncbi:MAG: methyl-accepting chemotaxis protein [Roseibium sp.]